MFRTSTSTILLSSVDAVHEWAILPTVTAKCTPHSRQDTSWSNATRGTFQARYGKYESKESTRGAPHSTGDAPGVETDLDSLELSGGGHLRIATTEEDRVPGSTRRE